MWISIHSVAFYNIKCLTCYKFDIINLIYPLSITFHLSLLFLMLCVQQLMTICLQRDANYFVFNSIFMLLISKAYCQNAFLRLYSFTHSMESLSEANESSFLYPSLKNLLFNHKKTPPTRGDDATVINCLIRSKMQVRQHAIQHHSAGRAKPEQILSS